MDFTPQTGYFGEQRKHLHSIKKIDLSKTPSSSGGDYNSFFGDDEVVYNPRPRRLSEADTPQQNVKSRLSEAYTPIQKFELPEETKAKRGRPKGSVGVLKKTQYAIERTPEENVAHFKERKRINREAKNHK